jgi:predicted glycosyltransferase
MPATDYQRLSALAGGNVQIERFTPDFVSYLAAADLSVSMAGYNTCMDIISARIPALVWPFDVNREQRMRAKRLARMGALTVLRDQDLEPTRLATLMAQTLQRPYQQTLPLNIDGAATAAKWITQRVNKS